MIWYRKPWLHCLWLVSHMPPLPMPQGFWWPLMECFLKDKIPFLRMLLRRGTVADIKSKGGMGWDYVANTLTSPLFLSTSVGFLSSDHHFNISEPYRREWVHFLINFSVGRSIERWVEKDTDRQLKFSLPPVNDACLLPDFTGEISNKCGMGCIASGSQIYLLCYWRNLWVMLHLKGGCSCFLFELKVYTCALSFFLQYCQ